MAELVVEARAAALAEARAAVRAAEVREAVMVEGPMAAVGMVVVEKAEAMVEAMVEVVTVVVREVAERAAAMAAAHDK